ncbi:AT hook, DNA-binding motif protein [Metarhizium album ARSEF 1941]|uniref:AT hook, DNA-binding motif protein n=1 Tax=Metarhizium album (strain ARSEF 1941) TaxID=1081103 RepID=A0A0B2X109_METAS|nr:AT hook, DNA-binding motif protein [Metarhizium album ARSEF 1941]KHN99337.1 AT hook, DNA-binding motif protein [Metarhizium album ARSEF 1941]
MTSAVIADSDVDESDAASSPESITEAVLLPNSSPTTTTHPSGSTDPTFFKNIYNEHRDAANQHVTHRIKESGEVMDVSSFDIGFQETRGTVIHNKSLWDVPSSPDFPQPRPSKKQDGSLNPRTKITRGLRRQLDDIGYVSQEDELPETTAQSRKKRRVGRHRGSDDLVSTAPVSDPSLMVAPTALASQKERHASVHGGALNPATKPLEQRCVNAMSSGTATNLNTPRSNDVELLEASPGIRNPKPTRGATTRDCSPPGPVLIPVSENQGGAAKGTDGEKLVVISDDENEQGVAYAPGGAKQDNGLALEEMPRPTEKRKQRGRPRKKDTAAAKEDEGGKDLEANVKRKRGRPKKTAAVLKPDNDDEVQEETASAIPASVQTKPTIKQQPDSKVEQIKHLGPDVAETESHAAAKPATKGTPETETERSTSETKVDISTCAVEKTAGRTPSTPAGASGRPLYRIGLSKNTRIAPLLKVIRK